MPISSALPLFVILIGLAVLASGTRVRQVKLQLFSKREYKPI